MSLALVTIRLWAQAVLINAVILFIAFIPTLNAFAIAVLFIALVGGAGLSLPLVPAILGLLSVFSRMPYHVMDKLYWLLFLLILLTGVYCMALFAAIPFLRSYLQAELFICGTSIAMIVSVFWTKKSIIRLNKYHYEQQPNS